MSISAQTNTYLRMEEWIRKLQQHASVDTGTALNQLTECAAQAVPGAQYAGITGTPRHRDIETTSATGPYPVILDKIQRQHREGPCLSAAWEHHSIQVDDLAADHRWPHYRMEALKRTPIRSILAFRLFGDNRTAGALNFHAEQADVFDDESVEVGLSLATHTTLAWTMLRREEQFRSALISRDLIGQAKGMLMERFNIDTVAAFALLKRLSQESNTPVAQIASRVVTAGGTTR